MPRLARLRNEDVEFRRIGADTLPLPTSRRTRRRTILAVLAIAALVEVAVAA